MEGKVVIVTGSSSGIGAGIAKVYAEAGAKVTLTGRNNDQMQKVKQDCLASGKVKEADILTVVSDLNQGEPACKKIIDETVAKFGALDVLINNAGIAFGTMLGMSSIDDVDTTINVNLKAPFILAQLALPHLKETQGNIINVSSVGGGSVPSSPGVSMYCATKAAVDHITRCWSLELAPFNVRVNCLAPGLVETNLIRAMPAEAAHKMVEEGKKANPIKGVVTPEDCGKACLFLSGPDAKYITGTVLPVDTGLRFVF